MTDTPTNWPPGVTAEQLMAYADGALDSDEAHRLAELIEAHPALQAEVDAYVDSTALLQGTYDEVLDEPVPEHLEALVMAPKGGDNVVAFRPAKVQRTPVPGFAGWRQAAAASVILVIGGVIGSQFATESSPSLVVAGLLDANHPLSVALEDTPSNELVVNGDERFEAIQTFGTATGTVCREYESGNAIAAVVGIACRDSAGWHVEAVVANPNGMASGGDSYRPASGLDAAAIDEVLYGMGALPGFDSTQEECLLENGWDIAACKK